MANAITTAGIIVKYAAESTAGTRPTTASSYTQIKGIVSIPEIASTPSTIDVTELEETNAHQYTLGLRDSGGSITFTANLTSTFMTDWATLVSAYETAHAAGKEIWFEIIVPGITNVYAFSGQPCELGFNGAEVDAAVQTSAVVAVTGGCEWATAPA